MKYKGGGEVQYDPPPPQKKTTRKKPNLIRVKQERLSEPSFTTDETFNFQIQNQQLKK